MHKLGFCYQISHTKCLIKARILKLNQENYETKIFNNNNSNKNILIAYQKSTKKYLHKLNEVDSNKNVKIKRRNLPQLSLPRDKTLTSK